MLQNTPKSHYIIAALLLALVIGAVGAQFKLNSLGQRIAGLQDRIVELNREYDELQQAYDVCLADIEDGQSCTVEALPEGGFEVIRTR